MEIKQAIEILENHLYSGKMPSKSHFEALALAVAALKRQKWIPCSERLPETDGTYLCVTNKVKRTVSTARFYGESDFCDAFGKSLYHVDGHFQTNRYVTHWMPMPEPPEEGGDENAAD